MVDKETILQVLCGLMQNPTYLSQTDKYLLNLTDFSTTFEKYIFSAIYKPENGMLNSIIGILQLLCKIHLC